MSERPLTAEELVKMAGVSVAVMDRSVSYVDLTPIEEQALRRVFTYGIQHLKKVAPSIAVDIERQYSFAKTAAGIAKATFPVRKNLAFPCTPGTICVAWLFPQGIKYAATPSATAPCYTSYSANSWDIPITAGTPAYLFGDGTNFYKANPATDQKTFVAIFENGLVEVGTTPSTDQFIFMTEGKRDLGVYTVEPLVEIPVERNVAIYQYPTPYGATFIDHLTGVMWGFMPRRSGVATIKIIGLLFYEYDFLKTLKWVA